MRCPICNREVQINFEVIEEVSPIEWFVCLCHTMFHTTKVDKKFFGKLYLKSWECRSDMKEKFEYVQRTYLPMIEEMTFGRKFLDVGFTLPHTIEYMKERGWIASGMDLVPNKFIQGDFETYKLPDTYDYINMGHCLESFENPIKAIEKAYQLLNHKGILLITHPNPEMIFEIGLSNFNHWNYRQNKMFISKAKLEEIVKRIGFDIIVSQRNISQRFVMNNDLHLLLQKGEQWL